MSPWTGGPEWCWVDEKELLCVGGPVDGEKRHIVGRLGDEALIPTKTNPSGEHYRWIETTINGQRMEFLAFHALTQTEAENRLMGWLVDGPGSEDLDLPDYMRISDEALGHLCRLVSELVELGHGAARDPAELLAELIDSVTE